MSWARRETAHYGPGSREQRLHRAVGSTPAWSTRHTVASLLNPPVRSVFRVRLCVFI
jgi:hypothetical protein